MGLLSLEIILAQGKDAYEFLGYRLASRYIDRDELPLALEIKFWEKKIQLLAMRHPSRKLKAARADWSYYEDYLKGVQSA